MTDDRQDSPEPAIKPQVIDLDAEEVTSEPPPETAAKSAEPPRAAPPPPRRAGGSVKWIVAALVIGMAGGAWLYRDLLSSYLPSAETSLLRDRIGALEAQNKTVNEQLQSLSGGIDTLRRDSDGLRQQTEAYSQAIAAAAAGAAAAKKDVSTLTARLAAAEQALTAAKSDLDALRSAVAAAGSGGGTVDMAALAALAQRIEVVERDIASLKSGAVAGGEATAAAGLSQALADIKAKIAAGASYRDEFDRIARMVPAAPGLDVLGTHAAAGLPNAQDLAAELRQAIPTLPKPAVETGSGSESYWDSLWNGLTSIVTIRTIGEADWPALAETAASAAAAGDLNQAIAAIDAAEGSPPVALSQWRERAAQRIRLEAALDQAAEAVLRQIAALGGAQ